MYPSQMMQRASNSKKRSNLGARRRLRLLFLFLICFMSWAGYELWHQENVLRDKTSQLSALENDLTQMTRKNEQYKREVLRLHDPEYIEQLVRKEYHMMKDGETLFVPVK